MHAVVGLVLHLTLIMMRSTLAWQGAAVLKQLVHVIGKRWARWALSRSRPSLCVVAVYGGNPYPTCSCNERLSMCVLGLGLWLQAWTSSALACSCTSSGTSHTPSRRLASCGAGCFALLVAVRGHSFPCRQPTACVVCLLAPWDVSFSVFVSHSWGNTTLGDLLSALQDRAPEGVDVKVGTAALLTFFFCLEGPYTNRRHLCLPGDASHRTRLCWG